tara:strand:- start:93 stop:620 length:528 start_codon:yes stop_codon:yes gene_type:complete
MSYRKKVDANPNVAFQKVQSNRLSEVINRLTIIKNNHISMFIPQQKNLKIVRSTESPYIISAGSSTNTQDITTIYHDQDTTYTIFGSAQIGLEIFIENFMPNESLNGGYFRDHDAHINIGNDGSFCIHYKTQSSKFRINVRNSTGGTLTLSSLMICYRYYDITNTDGSLTQLDLN